MENTKTAVQLDPDRPTSGRRLWLIADASLVVVALASAVWACMPVSDGADESCRNDVVFSTEERSGDATWYLDGANVVHWRSGTADGSTSLAFALVTVPGDIRLLAHPDSLTGPLMRTADILNRAGPPRADRRVRDEPVFIEVITRDPSFHCFPSIS